MLRIVNHILVVNQYLHYSVFFILVNVLYWMSIAKTLLIKYWRTMEIRRYVSRLIAGVHENYLEWRNCSILRLVNSTLQFCNEKVTFGVKSIALFKNLFVLQKSYCWINCYSKSKQVWKTCFSIVAMHPKIWPLDLLMLPSS